jgi:hypothetical protein
MLTDRELEEITAVFRSFETGLREATIYPKVNSTYCLYNYEIHLMILSANFVPIGKF